MPDATAPARILVIDDDAGLLRLVEKALKREGFALATAGSGREGINWLAGNTADLMLLDLKLQDIEGRELVNHLASIRRSVPFIIITGQGDERVAVDMMKRGALDYLVKDVNFVELLPMVVRRGLAQLESAHKLTAAEKSSRESAERYRLLAEMAGTVVLLLGRDGSILEWSGAAERVYGYTAEEVVGKNYLEMFLAGSERPGVAAELEKIFAGVPTVGYENPVVARSGAVPTFLWNGALLRDGSGRPLGALSVGHDISRRKRDEQRRHLQYETSRLLAASDSLAETIPRLLQTLAEALQWDVGEFWEVTGEPEKLRVVHVWHAPARKLADFVKHSLKLSVSMFDGLPGRVLTSRKPDWVPDIAQFPPFERRQAAARAGLRSALAFPVLLAHRTLGVMAFLTHRTTEPDEDFLQLFTSLGSQIGQFMERKKAEEALREANEFGKQVINGAQAGIIVYGPEGKIVVWNPFMEQITGYRSEEVLGRHASEMFPFHHEQHFENLFGRALAGEVFDAADIPFDLPEKGKQGWTVARFAPWRDARREIVGVIVAVRDITERKRLENQVLEISEREQRKFGHDLHDGLGQRLTGLEMLSHGLADDLKAHAPALVKQARRLNHELRETVTQARLISHSLAPVPLEGDGLMRGLMELAASTSRIPGVACHFTCDPPVGIQEVTTATHLYRIAQEAVNNALKHGRATKIEIALSERADWLELSVENNGRAIPGDRHGNTGVGLNVMRYRAEMIGANLAIESGKRKGVRVTCTLRRKT